MNAALVRNEQNHTGHARSPHFKVEHCNVRIKNI